MTYRSKQDEIIEELSFNISTIENKIDLLRLKDVAHFDDLIAQLKRLDRECQECLDKLRIFRGTMQ